MEKSEIESIAEKAYDLGFEFEKTYRGCAQCVFAALQDALGLRNPETDTLFKALTGFMGGMAQETDGHCGAYSGGALMIGHHIGRERDNFADPEKIRLRTAALVRKLHDRFIEEFGTVTCGQIHRKIIGRPFYFRDPDEMVKFDAAGAHTDKCTDVVGSAARWTVEILAEEGLLKGR